MTKYPYKYAIGAGGPSQFAGTLDEEAETKLKGTKKYIEFKKMSDTDSVCGGILLAISGILQNITWKVDDDPKGILQESIDNVGWYDMITDVVSYLNYGFSLFEGTLKQNRRKQYVWKSMEGRPQTTIKRWLFDRRNRVIGFVQKRPSDKKEVEISLKRCLHFRTTTFKNNPEGKSLMRNAYRDWYYRTNIERIESIGIERDLTGLPVLTPSEDADLTDPEGNINTTGTWAWQIVQRIKRNEQEGIVLPFGWSFELLGSPGKRQFNLNEVIQRYDARIALSMLSQFLILGIASSSGSFALSQEQSELFYKAVEGFATNIAHTVNTQFIGASGLATLNGLSVTPKLVPIGANRPDLSEIASFLGRLLKFNVIQPDDRLEQELRRMAFLPEKDSKTSRSVESGGTSPTPPDSKSSQAQPRKDATKS